MSLLISFIVTFIMTIFYFIYRIRQVNKRFANRRAIEQGKLDKAAKEYRQLLDIHWPED